MRHPKIVGLGNPIVLAARPIPSRNQIFTGPDRRQEGGIGHGSSHWRTGKIGHKQTLAKSVRRFVSRYGVERGTIRSRVVEELDLLSQPTQQVAYEASLTEGGHAPTELISGFCDDLYAPKSPNFVDAFSEEELKALAHLYGLLVEASKSRPASVADMLRTPQWRAVVSAARELAARLRFLNR